MTSRAPRLLILPDFAEENWPSMDLCAEMLTRELSRRADVAVERFDPRFVRRATRVAASTGARNFDRLMNRMREYPRQARAVAGKFDLFHLVDHSYSQLVHELPAGRVGVFCHDLDTFSCVLDPKRNPRPWWFRRMTRRILHGLTRAAVVFHTTQVVREQILRHGLVDESRLVAAPCGVADEFSPRREMDRLAAELEHALGDSRFVLHVGSGIPRKRLDVLLRVFANLAAELSNLKLVRVGDDFTAEQRWLLGQLGIEGRVVALPRQPRRAVAELYRRAALVMQPSESEGFGLPVIEALACGAVVLASDIPVFREVGAEAVVYAPVGDVSAWTQLGVDLLSGRRQPPPVACRIDRASRYSWRQHAETIAAAYLRLA